MSDKGLVSGKQINSKNQNNLIKKMGRGSEQTFFQRRHTDGQQVHEKGHRSANRQGNADQDNEMSPHTHPSGYYQRVLTTRKPCVVTDVNYTHRGDPRAAYTDSAPGCTSDSMYQLHLKGGGRNDELGLVKNPCFTKYPIKRMKRQLTD